MYWNTFWRIQILWILNIVTVVLCTRSNSLKLVQILFRHGDRTPTSTYRNDPHQNWNEGWGQLTNVGKKQMYTLGLLLRKNYSQFISPYYLPETTYVKSSYADRCIASAQSVLAGLFPPVDCQIWNPKLLWQPIPVHSIPRALDKLIAAKKPCPVYDAALDNAYKSDRIKHLNKKNQELYKYLTKYTGENVTNIAIAETLYNTLEIERFYNLTLPEWTTNVSFDALRILAAESLAIFTDTVIMKRLKGGPLLAEMINNMQQKTNNYSLNLILYSGHDVTIVTLLRTLGFNNLLLPDYGAYIVFELHFMNRNYVVQVLYGKNYSSDAVLLNLPFCQVPCLLTDFIKRLKDVIPIDWETECDLK